MLFYCNCSQFIDNLLPNLAATFFGLVIGIPLALWTNRKIEKKQFKHKEKENIQKHKELLTIIKQMLNQNTEIINKLSESLDKKQALIYLNLSSTFWDTISVEFIMLENNNLLKIKLANYFQIIKSIIKINDLYLSYFLGIQNALSNATVNQEVLKNALKKEISRLIDENEYIISIINI